MEKQTASDLNVSEIMESIRAEIQEKGYNSEMLSFADVPMETETETMAERFDTDILQNKIQQMQTNCTIPLEREVTGNPISTLWKKLVRRMVRFYLAPYATEQNQWNADAAQAQAQVALYVQESRMHSTKALLERIETLELQQKNTKLLIEQQQAQIAKLQEKWTKEKQA